MPPQSEGFHIETEDLSSLAQGNVVMSEMTPYVWFKGRNELVIPQTPLFWELEENKSQKIMDRLYCLYLDIL
jgi:hypothetical protein